MCGRYTEIADHAELAERYGLKSLGTAWFQSGWTTYNAAPSQILPVVQRGADDERVLVGRQWGLIPPWKPKDGSKPLAPINARSETIFEKPMFRGLTKAKRCLVPATGFYEWRKMDGRKQPYYLTSADGEDIWSLAGLYDDTHDENNDAAGSFTILTTTPNDLAALVHDRMPVILTRETEELWLSPDVTDQGELEHLLRPYPAELMQMYPVGAAVGNVRNNSPELIEPEGEIERAM